MGVSATSSDTEPPPPVLAATRRSYSCGKYLVIAQKYLGQYWHLVHAAGRDDLGLEVGGEVVVQLPHGAGLRGGLGQGEGELAVVQHLAAAASESVRGASARIVWGLT